MAKNDEKPLPIDTADAAQQPTEFPLTLDEFCARLSRADKRVELIAGFFADEKRAGRIKDTEGAFRARFGAFMARPVG